MRGAREQRPTCRIAQVAPKGLHKGRLVHRLGALLHHGVQRREAAQHAVQVLLAKVAAARILNGLVPNARAHPSHACTLRSAGARSLPELVPQDRDAHELVAHEQRLLHHCVRVLSDRLDDRVGGTLTPVRR